MVLSSIVKFYRLIYRNPAFIYDFSSSGVCSDLKPTEAVLHVGTGKEVNGSITELANRGGAPTLDVGNDRVNLIP